MESGEPTSSYNSVGEIYDAIKAAFEQNDAAAAQLLVNRAGYNKDTVLTLACEDGDHRIFSALRAAGAKLNHG
jgi:seryl-tRNA(Sec) selenium transferase